MMQTMRDGTEKQFPPPPKGWSRGWVGFAVVLGVACAPKHDIESPSPFEEDDPRAQQDSDNPSNEASKEGVTEGAAIVDLSSAPGEINRRDLEAVLADGPGDYVGGIDVDAVVEGQNTLRGWRVLRWDYVWADLRKDDIILDVNGVRIVQPNDVSALWSALAKTERLEIHIERDGVPMTLSFEIVETDSSGSAPSTNPGAADAGDGGRSGVPSGQ